HVLYVHEHPHALVFMKSLHVNTSYDSIKGALEIKGLGFIHSIPYNQVVFSLHILFFYLNHER
ncbi:MAG: hypothetical protein U9M95_04240, partial [Candidatus Altiarchaeota archaeon]|nr:hypothetical protein [Candidatus Altiarchaeota archaeon]